MVHFTFYKRMPLDIMLRTPANIGHGTLLRQYSIVMILNGYFLLHISDKQF
uniref:Uncharacterized protein n=1 Tax=Rhizophora mucronata TaxID=61149 RepID=A0A2P2KD89_RHIMU